MLPSFSAESALGVGTGAHYARFASSSGAAAVVPQAINLGRAHARCYGRCLGDYIGGGFQCAAGVRSPLDCSLLETQYERCTGFCDLVYA